MRRLQSCRQVPLYLLLLVTCVYAASGIAVAQTAAPAEARAFWPHSSTIEGASVTVYQPQAISWPNHETLTARAAVAITPPGAAKQVLGTIELTLATRTDAATNMVILSNPKLLSSRFPSLDTDQAGRLDENIRRVLPTLQVSPVPLDAILLSLNETEQPPASPVSNDPPTIFYSDKPASLVVFDGDPVMAPVGKTDLSFAVNTNWEVFKGGDTWYLLNGMTWLAAASFSGPYKPVSDLPAAFASLPAEETFAAARKAVPPRAPKGPMPEILVSTKPAEIIVTQGLPKFAPVAGTGLQVVQNTNSVLFFQPSGGQFYVLISGRWFSAASLNGPWAFASDRLPPDFSLIPADGRFSSVLPSVPGTSQAQLAVLQANVPKQATISKTAAKLTVSYAGSPKFEPIPGTALRYAVNTSYQVIETGGRYYACYQGVWFEAASPLGPWILAVSVPQVIYTIPPTSPLYPVTFVKVYAATPTAVTYGFTAGYIGGFVAAGAVVYGTGYYYPPVVIAGPVPVYYPYAYSYAGNVNYNTATGAWTRGGTVYGPYGTTADGGSYYNPTTGAYAQGGSVYGPNGGVGGFSAYNPSTGGYAQGTASWNANGGSGQASYYNPRTGVSGATTQNANPYSRWGSSTFAGPGQTVNTASASNARGSAGGFQSSTGAEGAGYRGVNGNQGGAVRTQNGDVYAGHDGNAYQHTSSGWSQWNNGAWQPVNPPANTRAQTGTASATMPRSGTTGTPTTAQTSPTPAGQTASKQSSTGQGSSGQGSSGQGSRGQTTAQNNVNGRYNQTRTDTGNSAGTARTGTAHTGGRQSMNSSSYQQLEQDRQARTAGMQQFGGGGGRFGGGGFGGSGFGGGGRFRR